MRASDVKSLFLPRPKIGSGPSLTALLAARRTVRDFTPNRSLSIVQVSQMLWAAQGVTGQHHRATPSAGGTYPLELHLCVGLVDGLATGAYRYDPDHHALKPTIPGDPREALMHLSVEQEWMADASIMVVISAILDRTMIKYHNRGKRYVLMEVGHAAQNLLLMAEALELDTATVGEFDDEGVRALLAMQETEYPYVIFPIGPGKN